jgi:hypothetical protein
MDRFKKIMVALFLATQIVPLACADIAHHQPKAAPKVQSKFITPKVLKVARATAYRGGMVVSGLATAVSALMATAFFAEGIYRAGSDCKNFLAFGGGRRLRQTPPISFFSSIAFASLAYNCASLAKSCHEKACQVSEEKKQSLT